MALSKIIGDGLGEVNEASNYEIDCFRMTADFGTDGNTLTNWERPDDASTATVFAKIGTGLTESSGTFSFPRTGLYQITLMTRIFTTNTDAAAKCNLEVTTNNSDYDVVSSASVGDAGSDNIFQGSSAIAIINVTNTTNVKFRWVAQSLATGSLIEGSSTENRTAFICERKGPSQ